MTWQMYTSTIEYMLLSHLVKATFFERAMDKQINLIFNICRRLFTDSGNTESESRRPTEEPEFAASSLVSKELLSDRQYMLPRREANHSLKLIGLQKR
jgi:hypothetical protein